MKKIFIVLFTLLNSSLILAQNASDAVDLGLSVNWASHNIGAKHPEQSGSFFAWGEYKEKSYYFYDTYEFTDKTVDYQSCIDIGNHIANTSYDAAHILWGGEWKMPSENEFAELIEKCEWIWTNYNGVEGYKVIGTNGNSIFLPASGKKFGEVKPDLEGGYWSETVNGGLGRTSRSLWFTSSRKSIWGESRVTGMNIRPVIQNKNYVAKKKVPSEWNNEKYSTLLDLIDKEKYQDAYNEAMILSSTGDAQSKCVLATMYLIGSGTFRDYESAQSLLSEAAEAGYSRAEYMLGGFGSLEKQHEFQKMLLGDDFDMSEIDDNSFWFQMLSSNIKPENLKEAFRWFYLENGKWGYRDIMYYAGISLITGQYGYQNPESGLKWLIKSAELGYSDAINLLERLQNESEQE